MQFSQTKTGGTMLDVLVRTQREGVLSGLTAPLKASGVAVAVGTGSPNDQGERDPTDFPRIEQSTRKSSYTSAPGASVEEDAVYRVKFTIESVEAFFVYQLGQGGWEESKRFENGDPISATHQIVLYWSRMNRSAQVTMREVEPTITEISITVRTSQPNPTTSSSSITPPKG